MCSSDLDSRGFDPACAWLDSDNTQVAVAAVAVVQTFLDGTRAMEALDRLTGTALDRRRAPGVRLAAIRALRGMASSSLTPLLEALGADPDPAIVAAAGGIVIAAERHPEYGNMIEIDHGNDFVTRYAHASKLLVKVGDVVQRGMKIAEVGEIGRAHV